MISLAVLVYEPNAQYWRSVVWYHSCSSFQSLYHISVLLYPVLIVYIHLTDGAFHWREFLSVVHYDIICSSMPQWGWMTEYLICHNKPTMLRADELFMISLAGHGYEPNAQHWMSVVRFHSCSSFQLLYYISVLLYILCWLHISALPMVCGPLQHYTFIHAAVRADDRIPNMSQ